MCGTRSIVQSCHQARLPSEIVTQRGTMLQQLVCFVKFVEAWLQYCAFIYRNCRVLQSSWGETDVLTYWKFTVKKLQLGYT